MMTVSNLSENIDYIKSNLSNMMATALYGKTFDELVQDVVDANSLSFSEFYDEKIFQKFHSYDTIPADKTDELRKIFEDCVKFVGNIKFSSYSSERIGKNYFSVAAVYEYKDADVSEPFLYHQIFKLV